VSRVLHPLMLLAMAAVFVLGACASTPTATPAGAVKTVSPADAVAMLDERTVIDVRTPAEYAAGHVAGAIDIDVEAADFGQKIAELDPKDPYLVYCRSGRRSALAAEAMAKAGFTDIVDAGGLDALAKAGAPIE
jgi:phage shock protein E